MVTILGKGVWGHALASLLEENKQEYIFWDRESAIDPMSIVVIAIPTQAIREVLTKNKKNLRRSIIVNSAKGIEKKTHKLPFQIAREVLGGNIKYLSLYGPSFAHEVTEKMPTMVNLASIDNDKKLANKTRNLFQTDYFRIKITSTSQAIELAGALKNIYAIACGISEGLGFNSNTRSQLIGLAYQETRVLSKALGHRMSTGAIEGIMGDLILTCSSNQSRNFRFGKLIVSHKVERALKKIASTVEGSNNCLSVEYFIKKTRRDIPLAQFVYETVKNDSPDIVGERFRELIKRS